MPVLDKLQMCNEMVTGQTGELFFFWPAEHINQAQRLHETAIHSTASYSFEDQPDDPLTLQIELIIN